MRPPLGRWDAVISLYFGDRRQGKTTLALAEQRALVEPAPRGLGILWTPTGEAHPGYVATTVASIRGGVFGSAVPHLVLCGEDEAEDVAALAIDAATATDQHGNRIFHPVHAVFDEADRCLPAGIRRADGALGELAHRNRHCRVAVSACTQQPSDLSLELRSAYDLLALFRMISQRPRDWVWREYGGRAANDVARLREHEQLTIVAGAPLPPGWMRLYPEPAGVPTARARRSK